MNIKNYLEVHVKIVPAGNLIYYDMISYRLRRFSLGVVNVVYYLQLVHLES